MTYRMNKALMARVKALEGLQGVIGRSGLLYLEALIRACETWRCGPGRSREDPGRSAQHIVAVAVGGFDGSPVLRVQREQGEGLDALEARANPAGCWRAAPRPVFADDETPCEEAAEALWMVLTARGGFPA